MFNSITVLDSLVYTLIIRLQQRTTLTSIFRKISHTGDGHAYVVLVALVYWVKPLHYLPFTQGLLVGFLIELPCFMLLKLLIKRDRPFVSLAAGAKLIEPSDKFSMPSGHTAAAFLVATMIATYYVEFTLIGFLWAGLIGLSRILLGVHYPGDILAGALLGYASSTLALMVIS